MLESAFASVLDKVVVVFMYNGRGLQTYMGPNTEAMTILGRGKGYWVYAPFATSLSTPDLSYSLAAGWNLIAWVSANALPENALAAYRSNVYFVLGFDAAQQKWLVYESPLATVLVELQDGNTYNSFMDTRSGSVSLPMGNKTLSLTQFGSWTWDP